MSFVSWFDQLHDKIDPLDGWIQKQVLGNQQNQEHFIATYGPIIGAAFTGGATLGAAGAGAAGAAGGAAGGTGLTAAGGGLLAAEGAGAAGMGGALGSGLSVGAGAGAGAGIGAAEGAGMAALGAEGAGVAGSVPYAGAAPSAFQTAMGYAKPVGQAINTASQAKGLLSQPKQPAPQVMTPMPNSNLGNIVNGFQQQQANQMQMEQQARINRRNQRRGLL